MTCKHLGAIVLAALATVPALAQDNLAARVGEVIRRPEFRNGAWSMHVVDLGTGAEVYSREADRPVFAASVMKLFSGVASLAEFGPDFKFETPVYRTAKVGPDGVLNGDLILVGVGDPTLGGRTKADGRTMAYSADDHTYANSDGVRGQRLPTDPLHGLKELARLAKTSGIRSVRGDVLVDDRLFPKTRSNGNGPDWLSPVMVNDNLVDVEVHPPARPGERIRVGVFPPTKFVRILDDVEVIGRGGRALLDAVHVQDHTYRLTGRLFASGPTELRTLSIQDPTAFARSLFIQCLLDEGVRLEVDAASTPRRPLPERVDRLDKVASFISPPFSELLKVTLKVSSNVYANQIAMVAAKRHDKATLAEGVAVLRKRLEEMKVDLRGVKMESASGCEMGDRLTPRALTSLLAQVVQRKDAAVFLDALPVLGEDGTLADFVSKDSPARGKVRAKTGTYHVPESRTERGMLHCKALAGIITTANGRSLAFAFFLNEVPLERGDMIPAVNAQFGKLCEIFYQHR